MLQPASAVPLVLRHIPIWQNDVVTGFIDLALERAFVYREHAPSEVVDMGDEDRAREVEARYAMLETLADYDDGLMEQLLEDIQPAREKVFTDLVTEMRAGLICPVLIGSAEHGNGVGRLLKAIRHEAPGIAETRARLGVAEGGDGAGPGDEDAPHHPRRQAVGRAGAVRHDRRRRRTDRARSGPVGRVSGVFRLVGQQAIKREAGDRPARPSASASSTAPGPA